MTFRKIQNSIKSIYPCKSVVIRKSQLLQAGVVMDAGPTLDEIHAQEARSAAELKAKKAAALAEAMEEEVEEIIEATSATMRPITGTMTPLNVIPKDSVEQQDDVAKATLRPVQRLTPISSSRKEIKTASITPVLPQMKPADEESDES